MLVQPHHIVYLIHTLLIQCGNKSKKDKKKRRGECSFLFVPFCVFATEPWFPSLLLWYLVPLGSLGDIYSAMEGRRRRRSAHGVSFTITWKFPAWSCIPWTLYPALALIPALPREKWSVTEQINVHCFLGRLDRPMLTAEAVILPGMMVNTMMLHHRCALQLCELHQ